MEQRHLSLSSWDLSESTEKHNWLCYPSDQNFSWITLKKKKKEFYPGVSSCWVGDGGGELQWPAKSSRFPALKSVTWLLIASFLLAVRQGHWLSLVLPAACICSLFPWSTFPRDPHGLLPSLFQAASTCLPPRGSFPHHHASNCRQPPGAVFLL